MAETERIAILLQLENDNFEKKAQSAAKAVQRIEQRFDPLAKAAQRYEREQLSVNKALASGKIDADRAQKALDNLAAEYQQATGGAKTMGGAMGGLGAVTNQTRSQIQNASFQIQDLVVQIQGGTKASTALAQQLPQLLGGFGAVGAALGVVVGLGIPLIATLVGTKEEAETLEDQLDRLKSAVEAYSAAAELAQIPTVELAEKYGTASDAARTFLLSLRDISERQSLGELATSLQTIATQFGGLSDMMKFSAKDARELGSDLEHTVDKIQSAFSVTADEAQRIGDALVSLEQSASGSLDDQNVAAANLIAVLGEVAPTTEDGRAAADNLGKSIGEAGLLGLELDATLSDVHDTINSAAMAAYEIGAGIYSAMPSADTLLIRMREIAGAAWDAAAAFTAAQNAEAKAALAAKLAPLGNDERGTQTDQVQSAGEFRGQQNLGVANARSSTYLNPPAPKKVGGGSKAKKAGAGKTERPFFEDVERDIVALERQIEMVGKSSAEVAELTARYTMLDEAKKRGITVTDELSAKINAESAEVGQLAAQYEAAQDKVAALEDLNTQWKDSLIDAAMGVEGAFDGVIDAIKRAAIEYALFGSGTFANIGGGGGGLGGLASAAMNAFGGFRANGGSVSSGKSYVVGERGPELFTPPSGGKIIPNNKLGGGGNSGGAMQVTVGVSADNNGNLMPFVQSVTRNGVQQGMGQIRKEIPGVLAKHTKVAG